MKRLACVALMLLAAPAYPEESFVTTLEGAAAACSITSSGEATEAFLVGRDHGTSSSAYKAAIAKAFKKAKSCVDQEKPKMRPELKQALGKNPELKPAIIEAYAKWIGYMDWLSTPRDWLEESQEKTSYEQSINKLKAEIDAL
ncbi:hypothetical protein [Pseudomonas sp. PS01300]|uniref:hypothetical protein n=1 Tax=Pseudomonas sp. PS01300 TaxID=2991436 RepID=UPI00249ABC5F|nr:hypothetical protein [Pseudomonas sp. PS01300]